LVADITRTDIASVLALLPGPSRNNILRTLRALFRYGLDLGFLSEVPIRRNDFAQVPKTEIEVMPPVKIRTLLEAAWQEEPLLLPLLLVETFGGVRPAEAVRLIWSDVDLRKGRVTIRASVSKTRSARPIELAPCAVAWFEAYATAGYQCRGSLLPFSAQTLRRKLRKVRVLAGYDGNGNRWKEGALRDAFCSYHLGHYQSVDRLIVEAGHTSLQTTKNHYLGLVTKEQAAEFWNLFPPGGQTKVIQFATG